MTGGASIDRFIFNTNKAFDSDDLGADEISDFVPGQDIILLDTATFTALGAIETDFASVNSNGAAANSDAIIVYNSNNGNLYYNQNGSAGGFGSGGLFATLADAPVIEAEDFFVRS